MQQSGAQSATLRGDAPLQLQSLGSQSQGATLSGARIEELLAEIAPPDTQIALQNGEVARFDYAFPLGLCRVEAMRESGTLELKITPTFAPAPRIAPPIAPAPAISINNDSGQKDATLPPELRGFNWGGLLLSYIWAVGNKSYVGLLGLIPIVGILMRPFLGFKGNEMAWRNRRWESIEQFRATQKTWTVAGLCIVLGFNFFALPIMAAVLFPVFGRARENARRASCQNNMKQIAYEAIKYADANGGKLPSGTTIMSWKSAFKLPETGNKIYYCPSVTRGQESYLINRKIVGLPLDSIPDPAQTPLFYEAEVGHLDGINVAFADGHIKWFKNEVFDAQLRPLVE